MVYLRILHAKNQHPRPKTVAYRPRTDTHTHRQTEKANTEDPFFRKNFFLIFDFLLKGAVRLKYLSRFNIICDLTRRSRRVDFAVGETGTSRCGSLYIARFFLNRNLNSSRRQSVYENPKPIFRSPKNVLTNNVNNRTVSVLI